jgi:ABC-type transport system involved in multi-copper enzyme maturation permease subunit
MSATVIVETLRRHFAHVVYVAVALLTAVLAATMAALDASAGSTFQIFGIFAVIAGCQIIGPEFSSGTLQLILSKPIHRASYLLSRVAGVVLALWIVIAVALIADLATRAIAGNELQAMTSGGTAAAFAAEAVLICALMALFGSFSRSYFNVAVYLGGQILLGMIAGMLQLIQRMESGAFAGLGAFLREHTGILTTVRAIDENLYPEAPRILFDRNWFLMVFCNAAIALLLACLVFRRREVPYGAD